jgi:chloramphenicol 3-O phosphotransferase
VENGFLGGVASQQRWMAALDGLTVLWVGVRCDAEIATSRERTRADRTHGMARLQADSVHVGITYDLEVHTDVNSTADIAMTLIDALQARSVQP